MWISKEEYNQLKTERDYYEQQLKNWEQEWKNAYVKTNPIDGKEKYKTTSNLENLEIKIPDLSWFLSPLVDIDSGYMKEKDWLNLVGRYEKELKSKNELVEELQKEVTRLQKQEIEMNNYKKQFKPIMDSHTRLENYVSELRKDLIDISNSKNELNEALDHQAKRNNELFKLNERLCNKILELEKDNNELKKEKTPVDYLKYYFLEDEVKQLVDLLEVALRDMTLRSTNTIYELQYDSFSHVYRILTIPKTK